MRVRGAVIATMTRGRLRQVVRAAGISGLDTNDQTAMALALNASEQVSATFLMESMDLSRLSEACAFLGIDPSTTYEELLARAEREDRRTGEQPPAREPDESDEIDPPEQGVVGQDSEQPRDSIVRGALVTWEPHGMVGVVERIEHRRIVCKFEDGEKYFALRNAPIRRLELQPGQPVMRLDGSMGIIQSAVTGQEIPTWNVWFGNSAAAVAEMALRPAVVMDPVDRLKSGELGSAKQFNLRSVAMDYWTAHRHNELVSLANARVDLKPYQVSVVHTVISDYPHRYLLCDEVGLGKTIEAAMIVKELRARGQARRVLILAPSGLLRQWQFELKTKFNETFAIYNKNTVRLLKDQGHVNPWSANDSVIASHAWASWNENRRKEIASVDWDLVIVDEAHHARRQKYGNSITRTNLYRLVEGLVAGSDFLRRAALFLTATPLQLERYELYSLVEMLNPALFSSDSDFSRHVSSLSGLNQLVERLQTEGLPPAEDVDVVDDLARFLELDAPDVTAMLGERSASEIADELRRRHRLSEVMIRNRKALVAGFQPRVATRWEVELSPSEREVQRIMHEVIEEGWRLKERTNQNAIGFLMVILQKLLASSSRALLASLEKRRSRLLDPDPDKLSISEAEEVLEDDEEVAVVASGLAPRVDGEVGRIDRVIEVLRGIDIDSKAVVLSENLQLLFADSPDEKVLIFTEFRETQAMLAELLGDRWSVHIFHGQLSPDQKDSAVDAFRRGKGPQVLVSTEAGGEGRNFQFCHVLVNYDLPWNPMKVEQRIGRLDRIGQEHPVSIFNFHVQGTIEGRILEVLERRIKVFEESVGALDPILGEAEGDIRKAMRLAQDARDARIIEIGERLEREIELAREAEKQFGDFIMDAKSYKADIVQRATGEIRPIDEDDFELFLERLLAWAHAYIGPEADTGERTVEFHAPFTVEHPELFGGLERRRVCLDPGRSLDSELVEYLGFGHPIIDALVTRVTEEKPEGAAAIRRIDGSDITLSGPGWQFNWTIRIGGVKPAEFVHPVFVSDADEVDADLGRRLLERSRSFPNEAGGSADEIDTTVLDRAHGLALEYVGRTKEELVGEARVRAEERVEKEQERVHALFEQRQRAARDKIRSSRATLGKMEASSERASQLTIPMWEANVARAEAELEAIKEDRERALAEIKKMSDPTGEFSLLNVARIEPVISESEV
jgi:SNF2 family DNA or RNA helicase